MTPEVLRQAAILLFGDRGWMSRLAEALGVDRSSVSRWFAGLPAPGPVVAAVEAWLIIYKLTGIRPYELDKVRRTLSLVTAEPDPDETAES